MEIRGRVAKPKSLVSVLEFVSDFSNELLSRPIRTNPTSSSRTRWRTRIKQLDDAKRMRRESPRAVYHDWSELEEITIALQGDPHVGNHEFDEDRFKRDRDWAIRKGVPWLNMGDALETATRNSVGAGVYEQTEIVDEQLEHYIELVTPLVEEGLFLGNHYGNHERRIYKDGGLNLTKCIARETGTPYWGVGIVHFIRVGNERYTMYTTHGSGGARMPHTKIKKAIDMEKMIGDVDVYAMAHLHTMSHHARQSYRPNWRNRTLEQVERHFIITGAYLNHWGSYAHESGMEPCKKGSARITFFGNERNIKVSL